MNNEIKSENRLFISPFSRDQKKHPSIKNLIQNQEKNLKSNFEKELNNNFMNRENNEIKEIISNDKKKACNYHLNIINVNTELYTPDNTFYMRNNNKIKKDEIKFNNNSNNNKDYNSKKINKNNLYYFNEEQLKLDFQITNQIKCGQDYEKIEKSLIPFLNVSKSE